MAYVVAVRAGHDLTIRSLLSRIGRCMERPKTNAVNEASSIEEDPVVHIP